MLTVKSWNLLNRQPTFSVAGAGSVNWLLKVNPIRRLGCQKRDVLPTTILNWRRQDCKMSYVWSEVLNKYSLENKFKEYLRILTNAVQIRCAIIVKYTSRCPSHISNYKLPDAFCFNETLQLP